MKLIGIARLGKDAELRHTGSGKAVANLSLAYNYGQKDDNGNRPTQWIEAALWGEQAERLAQYLLKGTALNVTCRDVHIETYEGKNGAGHKLAGTIADIEFLPKQRASDAATAPEPAPQPQPAAAPANTGGAFDDFDDDIPF